MLKAAGKAPDGTARGLEVVVDKDNHVGLKVVDVAPAGYDESSDTLKVQMSNRRVFKQTIFPRTERTSSTGIDVNVPDGAIGFMAFLTWHSSSGNFETGEGIQLEVAQKGAGGFHSLYYVQTRKHHIPNGSTFGVCWYPGANGSDVSFWTNDAMKFVSLPVVEVMRFTIRMDGTNPKFDCELNIHWLF